MRHGSYISQDWTNFKLRVHDFKGLGGNFGYPGLTELAAKLEFQLLNNNRDEVSSLFEEFMQYAGRIHAGMYPNAGQPARKAV